jgi:hypothetical protein
MSLESQHTGERPDRAGPPFPSRAVVRPRPSAVIVGGQSVASPSHSAALCDRDSSVDKGTVPVRSLTWSCAGRWRREQSTAFEGPRGLIIPSIRDTIRTYAAASYHRILGRSRWGQAEECERRAAGAVQCSAVRCRARSTSGDFARPEPTPAPARYSIQGEIWNG